MANRPFTKGIHDLGHGLYGYVLPDGTWGWSNAGLITSRGEALLVDTLMSVPLTREMLEDFHAKIPASRSIGRMVNTHANPDHFNGNQLLKDAEIIATRKTAEDMAKHDPDALDKIFARGEDMGEIGEFLLETVGRKFDRTGIELTLPTRHFEDQLTLTVGDLTVDLVDLGPAHTRSDIIAVVREAKAVFTGDLLFNECTPVMWTNSIENWISACDYILELDIDVVVPGHGPITDKTGVRNMKAYLEYVWGEARKRFDAGLNYEDAARDIHLREFRDWGDPERIVANVYALYRAWGANVGPPLEVCAAMGRYLKARHAHDHDCGHEH